MKRRRLLALGATAATSGCLRLQSKEGTTTATVRPDTTTKRETSASTTATGPTITKLTLPDRIESGTTYLISVTLENDGDSPVTRTVEYYFDSRVVFQKPDVTVAAGGQKQVEFRVDRSMIAKSVGNLEAGKHTHGFVVGDDRVMQSVQVVERNGDATNTQSEETTDARSETTTETDSESGVTLKSVGLPDVIQPGKDYTVSVILRNTSETDETVTVAYYFEGQKTIFSDVTVPAGGSQTTSYTISAAIVETSYGGDIDTGTYTHSVRLSNGRRETATVKVESSDVSDDQLSVGSLDAPDSVPLDGTFTAATTVTNTDSETAVRRLEYRFEGTLVYSRDGVRIEPNDETRVSFELPVDDIETSLGFDLTPGTYRHELVVSNVGRASGSIELTESG